MSADSVFPHGFRDWATAARGEPSASWLIGRREAAVLVAAFERLAQHEAELTDLLASLTSDGAHAARDGE